MPVFEIILFVKSPLFSQVARRTGSGACDASVRACPRCFLATQTGNILPMEIILRTASRWAFVINILHRDPHVITSARENSTWEGDSGTN